MHTVYLALGTNVGNRREMLNQVVEALGKELSEIVYSNIYETKPWGFREQENFFNMVIKGITELSPQALLHSVRSIEKKLGRQKRFRNGPREIDIDIVFYDELVLHTSDLIIPHPRIAERDFVLQPLIDIDPNVVEPVAGKAVAALYEQLAEGEKTIVRKIAESM